MHAHIFQLSRLLVNNEGQHVSSQVHNDFVDGWSSTKKSLKGVLSGCMQENACCNETPEDWPYISEINKLFFSKMAHQNCFTRDKT